MIILGIETSCDETAIALLEGRGAGTFRILQETVTSQIKIHRKYGGVVPEVAARRHAELIIPAIEQTLGKRSPKTIDVIAVTGGPGLMTSLMVGTETARVLAYLWKKPVVRVNHMEAHIASAWLRPRLKPRFPAVSLTVSGGHTELVLIKKFGTYKLLGRTLDDAAGEAFDKVAKILGLQYPGGPEISKRALRGNPAAFDFPRPMVKYDNYSFSFAGLKTAVLYERLKHKRVSPKLVNDLAASFQTAVVETLVAKAARALEREKPKSFILAGGVAANTMLRQQLTNCCSDHRVPIFIPAQRHTTDNATMIAAAGYFNALKKNFTPWQKLTADANWELV